ncbi:MAG TPA: hypothetical protein VF209_02465 [Patescibacteria group bacterium]
MNRIIRTILLATIVLLNLYLVLPISLASAQSAPIDLSVSPPTEYIQVAPGKSISHTVTIEQHGSLPLRITPSIVDFASDGETGQPVLQFEKGSSFRYLKIKNPDVQLGQPFSLNPGQKKQIVFQIEPPSEAVQGEFPLTLLFTAQPPTENTIGTGSQVSGMVGSNLVVLVSTGQTDKGKLVLEKIRAPRLVDSFGSLAFSLLAKNNGRNATTASGSATITNWQNQIVAEYTFYPDMILAQTSRLLRHGQSVESDAADNITADFKYKPAFLIGPYTITASLNENGLENQSQSLLSIRVFAFPFSLLIVTLLGVVLYFCYRFLVLHASSKND